MALEDVGTPVVISTNATTVIIGPSGVYGPALQPGVNGILLGIEINNPGASWVLTVYDAGSVTGTPFAVIACAAGTTFRTKVRLKNGLTIVSSGTTPGNATAVVI